MNCQVPVALIVFNRPILARAVFEAIAQVRPRKLLLIADGPRYDDERQQCVAAQSVIAGVHWDCEILTNVSEKNLGCRRRVVSGLNWVFSLVDEAIILEDDCVPHASFFRYCEMLLQRYRDDDRVMEIGGCNYRRTPLLRPSSYYFSRYYHTLGWATWRRAWRHYDERIARWPEVRRSDWWASFFADRSERDFWTSVFDDLYAGGLDTSWDYQWQFARWCHGGLSAVPTVNLVSNIGFGPDATNTKWSHDFRSMLPVHDVGEIRHPEPVVADAAADRYRFRKVELGIPPWTWKFADRFARLRRALSATRVREAG